MASRRSLLKKVAHSRTKPCNRTRPRNRTTSTKEQHPKRMFLNKVAHNKRTTHHKSETIERYPAENGILRGAVSIKTPTIEQSLAIKQSPTMEQSSAIKQYPAEKSIQRKCFWIKSPRAEQVSTTRRSPTIGQYPQGSSILKKLPTIDQSLTRKSRPTIDSYPGENCILKGAWGHRMRFLIARRQDHNRRKPYNKTAS